MQPFPIHTPVGSVGRWLLSTPSPSDPMSTDQKMVLDRIKDGTPVDNAAGYSLDLVSAKTHLRGREYLSHAHPCRLSNSHLSYTSRIRCSVHRASPASLGPGRFHPSTHANLEPPSLSKNKITPNCRPVFYGCQPLSEMMDHSVPYAS